MTMEVNYGVAVTNKFALFLNEDEDPLDILRLQEENKTKKVDKKKPSTSSQDKDAKTKSKTGKTDATPATFDQKKPTAAPTSTTAKKDEKAPARTKPKPTTATQGESGTDKKQGKENDAPKRERRDEPGSRPRPQSGAARDAAPREGFNRPDQGEQGFVGRPNRGSRPQRFERGGFAERGERQEFGGSEKVEDGEGVRGGEFRRGGGGGRGRGGRGGVFRGGKREFDRHSGSDRSGVKAQDKRDGGGAHNWGTVSDQIQEQLNANQTTEETAAWGTQMETAEPQLAPEGTKTEEADAETNLDGEGQEQEKVLTLDEWKAQQGGLRIKAEFNIRKAGEGCAADPQWKKMVALIKKDGEEEEEEEEEEEKGHHGRHKTTVPIEIKFNQTSRRGFGGGRGRGRGGRGGGAPGEDRRGGGIPEWERPCGGPRGGKEQKAPSLSDKHDFPSLGGATTH